MAQKNETPERISQFLARLSETDRQCLRLVTEGRKSKEIARVVGLSPHTVDARMKSIMSALDVQSRHVAASLYEDFCRVRGDVTVTDPNTNLAYEIASLPDDTPSDDKKASTGEGDGSGDLELAQRHKPESPRDSGSGGSWLESPHPFATFFGGENNLSIGRRLLIITIGAVIIAIAFGVLANGLVGISRVISSP